MGCVCVRKREHAWCAPCRRVRWYALLGFLFSEATPQRFTAEEWAAELRKSYQEYEWLERETEQLSVNMEALDRDPCVQPHG
jgi:hypothetical protein